MKQLSLLLLFAFGFAATAQDARVQKIDSLISGLYAKGRFNGNILVAEKGNVIYEKSFGLRDEVAKLPLDNNSIFELASVSKQFTAMGIVLLQQKGKLQYDDKLEKYIPELGFYKDVTIRQLLNHTGGLPDYMELIQQKGDTTNIWTNKDMIALIAKEKPAAVFNAGTKFEYSNTGYALLASVIEKVSGKSYAKFLEETIFKPLKMERTFVYSRRFSPKKVENYAYGYVYDKNHKKTLPDNLPEYSVVWHLDGIVGDGTVNSTTGDLLKWDRALYTDKLATKASKELIFTPPVLPNDEKTNYGFGWATGTSTDFGKMANHSGGWPGYATFIERELDNDKTIIILQNNDVSQGPPMNTIRNLLYNKPVYEKHKEITLTEAQLAPFVGSYALAPGYNMQIIYTAGQLYTQLPGQDKFEIYPEAENQFFLRIVEAVLVFEKDEKGAVTKVTLKQNGREMPAQKVQ